MYRDMIHAFIPHTPTLTLPHQQLAQVYIYVYSHVCMHIYDMYGERERARERESLLTELSSLGRLRCAHTLARRGVIATASYSRSNPIITSYLPPILYYEGSIKALLKLY